MDKAGKVAIARVVIRSKENLVAIRSHEGVLTMETMLFSDEVVSPEDFDELQSDGKAKPSKKELDMAQQLIDSLSGDFDPSKYRDEYRDRVLDLIERKAQGEEIVVEAEPPKPKEVPDLMAALEASIASAKSPGGSSDGDEQEEKPKKKSASRSRSSSSNGKKKTAAKKS